MEKGITNLITDVARSVQLLKIDDFFALSKATGASRSDYIKSTWNVDGYDWEVRFFPANRFNHNLDTFVGLKLLLLSEARVDKVRTTLSCRLVDPSGKRAPSEDSVSTLFSKTCQMSSEVMLVHGRLDGASNYVNNDSMTVECAITVVKEPKDMHQHFGKLLQSQIGADVTFTVSGESFPAHKNILAARSPVFMAEFFGHMKERRSSCVTVVGVPAPVFSAMLHFIYTDTVPELDGPNDDSMAMAQLSDGINVNSAAATLALAEQLNCSQLKAKCVDFIISRSRENLDAVLATEGYKNLEVVPLC